MLTTTARDAEPVGVSLVTVVRRRPARALTLPLSTGPPVGPPVAVRPGAQPGQRTGNRGAGRIRAGRAPAHRAARYCSVRVTVNHLAGLLSLLAGALLGAAALRGYRWWRRRHAVRFTALVGQPADGRNYVLAQDGANQGSSLPVRDGIGAITFGPGDTLTMYVDPDHPGEAVPLNRSIGRIMVSLLVHAAVLLAAGGYVLVVSTARASYESTEEVVVLVAAGALLPLLGILGVNALAKSLAGLRGSTRVRGTVVDARRVPTLRGPDLHRPLVRYELDGSTREAWGSPSWRRPKQGQRLTLRLAGSQAREPTGAGCLFLAGQLALIGCGAVGLAALVALALRATL